MKILVTGATGFLGSHVCHRLIQGGYQVTILRRATSSISALEDLELNHAIGDVMNSETLGNAVEGHDWVVHAAAHISQSKHQNVIQNSVNLAGTRNVLRVCKQCGVKRLLHVSSVAAVGIAASPNLLADETLAFNLGETNMNYHISKHLAEKEVLSETQNGLDAVIVNPSWIFGPFGDTFRGGDIIDKVRRKRVVPYFRGGICAAYVDNVAEGIVAALKNGRKGERYILGGENVTFRKIAEITTELDGMKRILVPVPAFVTNMAAMLLEGVGELIGKDLLSMNLNYNRPGYSYNFYDSGKAMRELGYKPLSFTEILENYLSWERGAINNDN